nr:hypothetical protein [Microtetraspora sp. NBRC 13810]
MSEILVLLRSKTYEYHSGFIGQCDERVEEGSSDPFTTMFGMNIDLRDECVWCRNAVGIEFIGQAT